MQRSSVASGSRRWRCESKIGLHAIRVLVGDSQIGGGGHEDSARVTLMIDDVASGFRFASISGNIRVPSPSGTGSAVEVTERACLHCVAGGASHIQSCHRSNHWVSTVAC